MHIPGAVVGCFFIVFAFSALAYTRYCDHHEEMYRIRRGFKQGLEPEEIQELEPDDVE